MRATARTVAVLAALLAVPAGASGATAEAGDEPVRSVTIGHVERDGAVLLVGGVDQGYGARPVVVEQRRCRDGACRWVERDRERASDEGRYRVPVAVPDDGRKVTYRVAALARDGFPRTTSRTLTLFYA